MIIELPESFIKTLEQNENSGIELWHPNLKATIINSEREIIENTKKLISKSFLQLNSIDSTNEISSSNPNEERELKANKNEGSLLLNAPKLNCACRFIKSSQVNPLTQEKLLKLPKFKEIDDKNENLIYPRFKENMINEDDEDKEIKKKVENTIENNKSHQEDEKQKYDINLNQKFQEKENEEGKNNQKEEILDNIIKKEESSNLKKINKDFDNEGEGKEQFTKLSKTNESKNRNQNKITLESKENIKKGDDYNNNNNEKIVEKFMNFLKTESIGNTEKNAFESKSPTNNFFYSGFKDDIPDIERNKKKLNFYDLELLEDFKKKQEFEEKLKNQKYEKLFSEDTQIYNRLPKNILNQMLFEFMKEKQTQRKIFEESEYGNTKNNYIGNILRGKNFYENPKNLNFDDIFENKNIQRYLVEKYLENHMQNPRNDDFFD